MIDTATSILQTNNLSIKIGGKLICNGLNLNISRGQCWAILGCNGSGKTTLLQTLAGLRDATSGEVVLSGQPLQQYSRLQIARLVGVLHQQQEDPFPASVYDTVLRGRHPHLRAWQWENQRDHELTTQALSSVRMSSFAKRNIQSLSGGERQRIAIAELLAQDPQLLLLDEPSNHLDLHHRVTTLTELATSLQRRERLFAWYFTISISHPGSQTIACLCSAMEKYLLAPPRRCSIPVHWRHFTNTPYNNWKPMLAAPGFHAKVIYFSVANTLTGTST